MEIIGLIISVTAILFSLFTYLKHDRKINEQSKILNEYNIERINKEFIEAKKSIIEAYVINGDKGERVIKIYNKGRAIAKNVNIVMPESNGYKVYKNPCPIDIRPQNSIEIKLTRFSGGPGKIDLTFEWTDDYKENNLDKQTIQL